MPIVNASNSSHLLIPFAACSAEGWGPALKALPPVSFRHLGKLLQGMKLQATDSGGILSLSPPHERVLAAALGLQGLQDLRSANAAAPRPEDGLIPWAAVDAQVLKIAPEGSNTAWAYVTLCHWAMGREHATMTDPAALKLTPEASRTLMAAMQPYFETEGITLHYQEPGRWLAEGEIFRHQPTASIDRVMGRNVDAWLPGSVATTNSQAATPAEKKSEKTNQASTLRRLQNEMQMLLYTHPINDERASDRQLAVNSVWLSGTGALPQGLRTSTLTAPTVSRVLVQAAFQDDWETYAKAWAQLDATELAALLTRQNAGETVRLSLCGEHSAQTFETAQTGMLSKLSNLFVSPRPLDILGQL